MTASTDEGYSKSAELATIPLVLMFHSVSPHDEDPFMVTITPQRFERQMRWLRNRGLRGVSMGELLDAAAEGRARRLVGLTFDDGYADFVTNALPILQQYRFTATAFVLAGRFGGENVWSRPGPNKALLTAAQVREIASAGIEIASHGLQHVSLLKVDDAQLREETVRSRAILQELLGHSIRGFAYPYGHSDPRVVTAVQNSGYDYACAVRPWSGIGRHAIPRTSVLQKDSTWRLDAKRTVSALTVGNRFGVRRYRAGGQCVSQ
ncbi:polysaccharide deacetylase [Mycobacterium sp. ACS1612]|uniref:polysaccharide deacetylase family protein n=1 Tax=Mycobacterium sp. ACS1612 TaxID=1834117 RepID=UPI0008015292|nr:polysaccharide deacetylase family protein [Mycobacterium sp. ACS1612]OBF40817.1 polysaccharide deacetylase [Mycobacterium sp. ACS1612]